MTEESQNGKESSEVPDWKKFRPAVGERDGKTVPLVSLDVDDVITAEEAEKIGQALVEAARMAREMVAFGDWLVEEDVEPDLVAKLVMSFNVKQNQTAIKDALKNAFDLFGGGL